jgi:glucose-1-phosphate adenylyltransferase
MGDGWYSGTANAVWQNLDIVREAQPRLVLVLAGDHVYKMDYARLLAEHVAAGADATVACIEAPLADGRHFGVMASTPNAACWPSSEKPAGRPGPARQARPRAGQHGHLRLRAEFLARNWNAMPCDPSSSHDFGAT